MGFWLDIAAFALKATLIVVAVGALAALMARLTRRDSGSVREIEVRSLNERYEQMRDELDAEILDKKQRRALAKARKREAKARTGDEPGKRIFVLGFKGDVMASAVKNLAREIDAVLTVARPEQDEVVLRLHSPGGTVTGYGLGAAELSRLRDRKIKVTVSVDQVAASGGYMMACAGDAIVAAPFALIGSIGVVAQVPNLHRLAQEERHRLRRIDGRRIQALRFDARRDHAGRSRAFSRQDRRHPCGLQDLCRRAPHGRRPRQGRKRRRLARDRGARLGLVDALSTGDELLFRLKDEARLFEVKTAARRTLLQQVLGRFGFEGASAFGPLGAIRASSLI